MQPQAFYRVVADDFTAVDGIIRKQVVSRVPLVEKIGDYIISAGGKRLRPLLVLLSGKALGLEGDQLRLLAATANAPLPASGPRQCQSIPCHLALRANPVRDHSGSIRLTTAFTAPAI